MSAIWGILRFDGDIVAARDLQRMGAALAHRAPDGSHTEVLGVAGLGHGLMRVVQEDRFDAQPLHDADRDLTVVADLRLDNREELAIALDIDAAALAVLPDSALLLRAYRAWGERCAERLLGDFAFAIHDGPAGKLVLGRDHMGQRYLHYHQAAGFFAFATEAKGLHALPDIPRALDKGAIARSFLFDSHKREGASSFAGIAGVPGGSTMTVAADGTIHRHRYWQPRAAPEHLGRDEAYYVATYRHLLEEAVACRIRRLSAPPGLLLSGGYDSAAIAGLCGPVLPPGLRLIAATSALPIASVAHDKDARRGTEWCRAHMPHLDHHWFVRTSEGILDEPEHHNHARDGVPGALDYVFADLHRALRRGGARLVMDGIGGDETVNPRGGRLLADLLAAGRFGAFLRAFRHERAARGEDSLRLLRRKVLPYIAPGLWLRRQLARWTRRDRWPHRFANPALLDRLEKSGDLLAPKPVPDRDTMSDHASRTGILEVLQSRAQPNGANEAAAQGLELTRPMIDKRVVEFGLAIPDALLIVNGRNRYLAIRALADILPPAFRTRRRSQEHLDPAYRTMMMAAMPGIREQIARMRDRESLREFIDFDRLEAAAAPESVATLSDVEMIYLSRSFIAARYVAWFRRENL